MGLLTSIFYAVLGASALVAGGEALVRGAKRIAEKMRISPLVVGLTVVAICTSAPETAVSFSAALRATPENPGVADVALGNVVGSNICNVLLILGGTVLLVPGGIGISPRSLYVDLPMMVGAAALCVWFGFTGRKIQRWEGAVFLAAQIAYSVYLIQFAA